MFSLFVTVATVSLTITSVLMQAKCRSGIEQHVFKGRSTFLVLTKCPSASQGVQLWVASLQR